MSFHGSTPRAHELEAARGLPQSRACPLGAAMLSPQAWTEISRSLNLSRRELQIVRQIFESNTEFKISAELRLSPHTVHTYCERLYHNLHVSDRVKLVLRIVSEILTLTMAHQSVLPAICPRRIEGRSPFTQSPTAQKAPASPKAIQCAPAGRKCASQH